MEELRLTDLIDAKVLQQIQDSFSRFAGMAAITTDEHGIPITKGSGFTDFCINHTRRTILGCKRCEECDKNGALSTLREGKPVVYSCHAGLTDFAAPIMVEGKFLGSFVGGQVCTSPVDEQKLKQIAHELGIEPETYLKAAKEVKIMDKTSIEKAALFLYEIAQGFSKFAYRNFISLQKSNKLERAARSQSMFLMDVCEDIQESFREWLSDIKNASTDLDTAAILNLARDMDSQGQEVLSTVEDAMDYIRLSDGGIELVDTNYQIRDCIQRAIEHTLTLPGHNDLEVLVEINDSVPQTLLGDVTRISQIISKICQTIQHFSSHNQIRLLVSCFKESYATMLELQFENLGTTIDDEQLEQIREYMTNDKLYLDCMDEDALGLTMVRLLVHQMSGKIFLGKSASGKFFCSLRIPQLEITPSEEITFTGNFGNRAAASSTEDLTALFKEAIQNEEFQVYYQPKVDLKTYHMNGAEALCRWFHNGRMISPGEFIPELEKTGDICTLDFYMLEHVCQHLRRWIDEGRRVVKVSVNLSRCHTINEELLQKLLSIIDKYHIPHKYIEVELTETTTDINFTSLKTISYGLLDHGISTSVDDFGIGYSSLKLIQELPWNVLKIDRTFLPATTEAHPRKYVMLKHLISLSNDMGLKCIVEGVETIEHVKLLKKHNCYRAQGFYFDKPLPVAEFEKRLDDLPAKKIS